MIIHMLCRGWNLWRRRRQRPERTRSLPKKAASAEVPEDIEAGPSGTPTAAISVEERSAPELTRAELVEEFFRTLFPDDFQLALPVKKHKVCEALCGMFSGLRRRPTLSDA